MIRVTTTVSDPADQITDLGAGALLRLARASSEAGAYTEFATIALSATVNVYEVWDPAGDQDSWYKARYSEADDTNPTAYGAAFQAYPAAYAGVSDLLVALRQQTSDSRFLNRAAEVLADVTRDLTRELGHSLFRSPTTGTETVIFDGPGGRTLHVHGLAPRVGIVSVTTVQIRYRVSDAWTALEATDWRLESEPGVLGREAGDPYFHVALADDGDYGAWPKGQGLVRLVDAVFGWDELQRDHVAATVAWARQRIAADPSLPGGPLGPDEYGQPIAPDRPPRAVYELLLKERDRHRCWL